MQRTLKDSNLYKNMVPDEWLSAILGKKAYKLTLDDNCVSRLKMTKSAMTDFFTITPKEPFFVFCKVSPLKGEYVQLLENLSFHLTDTNITLEKDISRQLKKDITYNIRFAKPEDEERTVDLAAHSFEYSRFHLDSRIPLETANRVKGEWVRNFFHGKRGDSMVLASFGGEIFGFLQLMHQQDGVLVIDLIAVDGNHLRKGIASAMIAFAESHYENFRKIRVGTQGANIPSLRCYEYIGFRTISANYVFHYHYPLEV